MTHPHQRLHVGAHDRVGERRSDDEWLLARWTETSTRVLVVGGTRVASPISWVGPDEAPAGHRVLLGEHEGVTHFAVLTGRDQAGEDWRPLRGLLPELTAAAPGLAPLVLHAIGIAEWVAVTRFCPRCGGPLVLQASGHELACSEGHVQFPRTDPAVIMLITSGEPGSAEERCLLGRSPQWPEGRFSTLAGFCEPGETLEDAVRREVAEEAGVVVGEVTYVGNQPWPLPASLMLGFTGVATSTELRVESDELAEAGWFTRADLIAGAAAGTLLLPGGVSISHSLIEGWLGEPLPASW